LLELTQFLEKCGMAFENEIPSEEDIREYGLDELKKEFDEWGWRDGRPAAFFHSWTIDRERDLYFLPVKTIEESRDAGIPEPTTRRICILNWKGQRIQLLLDRVGCSKSFSDSPFRIVWDLLGLDLSSAPALKSEEVDRVLKEALTAYGYRGAHKQVPNTIVEFKF
jgi:hypothetical protein